MHPHVSVISSGLRLRQGLILLVGALAILLLIGGSPSGFFWTPLSVGLTYLVGALAGGRRGSYWATAVVLVGWGAAVGAVHAFSPNLDTAGVYLFGAGLGACAGAVLARRGVAVDPLGMAATIAAAGGLLALEPRISSVLGDARSYALFLAVVGVVNLALALVPDPGRRASTHSAG
ncbi:MAG TPA: hypothetical protein VFN48_03180 [Solirubrobacteraceae bacterium]|nr:hypothetical protein [Solirubrobacteraceae bacterium]